MREADDISNLCKDHGGTCSEENAWFACVECASAGIKRCECGGRARYFGEALMGSITCDVCGASLLLVGSIKNIRDRWNRGERGDDYDGTQ